MKGCGSFQVGFIRMRFQTRKSPGHLPASLRVITWSETHGRGKQSPGGWASRPSSFPRTDHDLSVTTERESAAIESGATDASRPAGFIRASRLLLDGLRIPLQQRNLVPRTSRRTRPSTDEPSAHPWHQISNSSCTKGRHFQVNAGIQTGPRIAVRGDG